MAFYNGLGDTNIDDFIYSPKPALSTKLTLPMLALNDRWAKTTNPAAQFQNCCSFRASSPASFSNFSIYGLPRSSRRTAA
ncbi:hypothetical protein SAMN04488040_1468 [Sulfitobacter marinus]|uniref:Uncharacterized protein n=1 Tax=Sulfitobacter marinus TaxID=394264 RepID=A0A1I6RTM8_9RHOB|nr:hypothetical protein SAMN04488040_1468 [Sulfitobacter marinus]